MDKQELYNLLKEKEKQVERKRNKRAILAILIYAAVIFLIIYAQDQLNTATIWHILAELAVCVFLGGIAFFFNFLIFGHLIRTSQAEDKMLDDIRKRISELE